MVILRWHLYFFHSTPLIDCGTHFPNVENDFTLTVDGKSMRLMEIVGVTRAGEIVAEIFCRNSIIKPSLTSSGDVYVIISFVPLLMAHKVH